MTAVYLASRDARREELLGYTADLIAAGIEVTSRWLDGSRRLDGEADNLAEPYAADKNPPEAARVAQDDVEDLQRADVVISFTETPPETFIERDMLGAFERTSSPASLDLESEVTELDLLAGRPTRGRRHVEYGMALAAGRMLVVVGPAENAYHLLPEVTRVDTWSEALELLRGLSDRTALAAEYLNAVMDAASDNRPTPKRVAARWAAATGIRVDHNQMLWEAAYDRVRPKGQRKDWAWDPKDGGKTYAPRSSSRSESTR